MHYYSMEEQTDRIDCRSQRAISPSLFYKDPSAEDAAHARAAGGRILHSANRAWYEARQVQMQHALAASDVDNLLKAQETALLRSMETKTAAPADTVSKKSTLKFESQPTSAGQGASADAATGDDRNPIWNRVSTAAADLRSTFATRLSAGGVADEWVTQLLRQGDAKVFKKYSQMKLPMKCEALAKLNRYANEQAKSFDTGRPN